MRQPWGHTSGQVSRTEGGHTSGQASRTGGEAHLRTGLWNGKRDFSGPGHLDRREKHFIQQGLCGPIRPAETY